MGIKIIDRTLTVFYDNTLPEDFKDLPLSEKTLFIRPFKNVQYESAVLRMEKLEPIIIDSGLDIVEYKSVFDGVEIIYRLYSRYEFENRTKLNFDIFPVSTVLSTLVAAPTFPVPTKLEKLTVTSENEVYFRRSDIEALVPELEKRTLPDQTEAPLPEQLGPAKVTIGDETYIRLDKLFPDASSRELAKKACEGIWGGKLYIYEYIPNFTLIGDDELQEHGLPEADEKITWVRTDDLFRPIDIRSDDPRFYYAKAPDGMTYMIEKAFSEGPSEVETIDFCRYYAKPSNARKLGLLSSVGPDGGQPASLIEEQPAEITIPQTFACNTIKEIDLKTCILTYQGVDSPISGKGVFGIRQLLTTPGREIPVSFFAETSADVCNVPDEDELEIESDSRIIYSDKKQKNAYNKGVKELLEEIKDLEARLNDAEGIEKKERIEENLTQKRKTLAGIEAILRKDNGWIDKKKEAVLYRKKIDDDGKRIIIKPSEQSKKETDRVRKLLQTTIERIHDENLKNHLTKSIKYGKELIYNPKTNPEWILLS